LTHDSVTYSEVRYFPDGKRLIARGIEPGHGARDYVIDVSTGTSKPLTPEGVVGTTLSPDARELAVTGPDGKAGVWLLDGGVMRPIPGLDSKYIIVGWTPDGASLYTSSRERQINTTEKVYRVNIATGKMDLWREFGTTLPTGTSGVGPPRFSSGGDAYAYVYSQTLSEAYVVKGLK